MTRKKIGYPVKLAAIALVVAATFGMKSFSDDENRPPIPSITPAMVDSMNVLPGELGALPAVPVPADNPQTEAKIELGKRLFFDTRMSGDFSSSCATCHNPSLAFTDALPRSRGFGGKTLPRNAPTVLNAAYNTAQFWDGRAATLDEQCKGPLLSPTEMNMVDEKHLVDRLNAVPEYRRDFQKAFGSAPSLDNVAAAIATFERTLVTPDSPFDRYARGDKSALTDQQKRGLIVFFGKGSCSECHSGANFTDNKYHNLGANPVPGNPEDLGRFALTHDPKDMGAFKTPSLRNVALTAPYMHDGSVATLEDVVEFYDRGGDGAPNQDKLIFKLNLTPREKKDLVAFLKTLTGTIPQVKPPKMYSANYQQASGGQAQ
ncbi:MAG TPA: cytochrome c peroxidase [Candidatus Angelobacter sp.]|nr:cytochrome c peroxidase [Candidatus Angelobacter sp.]